jgi:hypothetical protein
MDNTNSPQVDKGPSPRRSDTAFSEQIRVFREKKVSQRERLIEETRATYAQSNRWGITFSSLPKRAIPQ